MQRIACVASVAVLLLSGCAPKNQQVRSAPAPLLQTKARVSYTRQPLPPPPLPLPPKPQPRPIVVKPAPVKRPAVTLRSDLRPRTRIQNGRWQVIVVHHSAGDADSFRSMDRHHRVNNGWVNGLGYHFVIGNGVNSGDGQIYKGPRWDNQQTGAHCKTYAGSFFNRRRPSNFFNKHGVGICLIGNFDNDRPTQKQMAALRQLTSALCNDLNISPQYVYGHGQVTNKTACPGHRLKSQLAGLRSSVSNSIAMRESVAEAVVVSGVVSQPLQAVWMGGRVVESWISTAREAASFAVAMVDIHDEL